MSNDKTLELKLIAKDMLSAVVEGAQRAVGGLADAVKSGAQGAAGAWPAVAQGIKSADEKFSTLKATASQALGTLKDGWNLLIEPGLEAARVTAQTEAVIKSTGGAAGLTSEEIGNMAGAMSRVSGVSDEAAQAAENVLLRYKEIGGDTFPRVTATINDMAVALAEGDVASADLTGTAALLGKALSNPEQGLMQLERSVGKFSDAEKASIKEMMAHNDIAGAQAVILDKLEQKFGGAAKAAGDTLPGKMAKAQNAIENFQENIANVFIPIVGDAAEAFNTLTTGNQQMADAFRGSQAQMQADLIAGKMTLEDYNNGIKGMAQNVAAWDAATGEALGNQYAMTQAQVDGLIVQQNAAAAAAAAEQAARTQAAAVSDNGQAYRMINDAIADESLKMAANAEAQATAAAAQAVYRQSVAETVTKIDSMAQSLVKATDAQAKQMLAQASLDAIKTAYENGTISQQGFNQATDAVLLKYDLATPKSLAMAQAQDAVTKSFLDGKTPLDDFIASSDRIPKIAEDGKVTLQELASLGVNPTTMAVKDQGSAVANLKQVWDNVPRNVTTTYTIVTKGTIPEGGTSSTGTGNGKALGGPVYAGNPYIVGDNGREPFFPAVDGRILSRRDAMDALASSGGAARGGAPIINVSIAATMNSDQDIEETAYRVSEIIGRNWQAYQ